MSGKYDWKPGQGVRSVGDVFNLIVRRTAARRRAFGHTEYGGKARAHHRSGENAGSSEGFLRQSAKSDYGTFRQRPAGAGETVRKRHDEAGALMLILEDQHEHLGIDRVRAQQRRGSALV
jgi:hypothetical protein